MNFLMRDSLTILIFLPLAGVVAMGFTSRKAERAIRWTSLIFSLAEFAFALLLFFKFSPDQPGMQFPEHIPWITSPLISYHIGVDGLSLLLVLLTAFLTPVAILASWTSINDRVKEFFMVLLALECGMIGVFVSLDLFLFFIFWEAMLIPMYFLIGVWGHGRKVYAAVKFILYTMVGSALMLVAILYLYHVTGTFDLTVILRDFQGGSKALSGTAQVWLFLAFFLAFAIKVPIFPLHTWLPDAHTEAPTAGSIILAGVLLKMGTYGLLRFCLPLFPQAARHFAPFISVLALIGIVYGALVSMVQPDLKRLVAYSSVAHMGFVVLGIFTLNLIGTEGAIYQMLNHGVSTGALFLLVGMLYDRRHTRLIGDFGGLANSIPAFSTFFVIVALSSMGLPLLNGFVGEFLIILGAFHANAVYGAIAASGVILAAVYLLWMVQRVFYGNVTDERNRGLRDCSGRERFLLAVIVAVIVFMGVYPKPFLRRMDWAAQTVVRTVHPSLPPHALRRAAHHPLEVKR